MKLGLVVSVLLLVVLATGAFAQHFPLTTARALGMGNTGIGIADDAAAWHQNPAGLGMFNRKPLDGKTWANDVIGTYIHVGLDSSFFSDDTCEENNSSHDWNLQWSGWDACKKWGFGAGYGDTPDFAKEWGAGFGITPDNWPVAFGISAYRMDDLTQINNDSCDNDNSHTLFDLGAMYEYKQSNCAPIRIGALVRDVTDETNDGPFLGIGASWYVTPELLIAADVDNATERHDTKARWGAGAEYSFGTCGEWKARAGVAEMPTVDETDLTLGLGYGMKDWRIDAAWVDTSNSTTWAVGLGYSF